MKVRNSFVSNSSSTSFVVSLSDFSPKDRGRIDRLDDLSGDFSRCTGVIMDIDGYLRMFHAEDWTLPHEESIRALMGIHDDLVILRESDEQMGGEFSDVGLCYGEIAGKALLSFEYH